LPDSVEVAAHASEVKVPQNPTARICACRFRTTALAERIPAKAGLIGLKDRVEVLGGYMTVINPPGSGTALHVTIPFTGRFASAPGNPTYGHDMHDPSNRPRRPKWHRGRRNEVG
jgi:hypothetical protein